MKKAFDTVYHEENWIIMVVFKRGCKRKTGSYFTRQGRRQSVVVIEYETTSSNYQEIATAVPHTRLSDKSKIERPS